MNYLIFGDLHITQNSLKECETILNEILMLCNKYSITHVIDLGDTYDSLKPTSQELDLFSNFIKNLNRPITIIAANSHESETEKISIMNHFGVLNPMVTITKEIKDNNHLYCGHFILSESNINYGAKFSKDDFKKYVYCYLGHQHSYQIIKPNCVQLGSCRFVDFSEAKDPYKIISIISDYNEDKEQVHFLKLKTPIKMQEFILKANNNNDLQKKDSKNTSLQPSESTNLDKKGQEGKAPLDKESKQIASTNPSNPSQIEVLCQELDKLPALTKVKVKIMDFDSFRSFLPFVNKYSSKFQTFKYETSFEVVSVDREKSRDTETKSFKEALTSYLKNKNIDQKIKEILEKEIE